MTWLWLSLLGMGALVVVWLLPYLVARLSGQSWLAPGPVTWAATYSGALVSWALHPVCWALYGPWRLARYLAATAAPESSWATDATGALGEGGLYQFLPSTWAALMGQVDIASALYQGWAWPAYVQEAVLTDARWLVRLRLPVAAVAWHRRLWRYGPASMGTWSDALAATETRAWAAWAVWLGAALPVYGVTVWAWWTRRVRGTAPEAS